MQGTPPLVDSSPPSLWDVVIVGGGPAGLSAALMLGRCRRNVLLCDTGKPRNAASAAMHGFLSRDGIPPREFLNLSRAQLESYETVEVRDMEVMDVNKEPDHFRVLLRDDSEVKAKVILLATGLVDRLPEIEGIRDFYGVTVHLCPYCDGWEHRDEEIAVLGGNGEAGELALELLRWSRDVVLCTNGPPRLTPSLRALLEKEGVRIVPSPIQRLEGTQQRLERISFQDGGVLKRSALFFSPEQKQRSPLAKKLGCSVCEDHVGVECQEDTQTCIEGVFAAGNIGTGLELALVAAGQGIRAAVAINEALTAAGWR